MILSVIFTNMRYLAAISSNIVWSRNLQTRFHIQCETTYETDGYVEFRNIINYIHMPIYIDCAVGKISTVKNKASSTPRACDTKPKIKYYFERQSISENRHIVFSVF